MFDARERRPFSPPQHGNTVAQNFYFILLLYIYVYTHNTLILYILFYILYVYILLLNPPMTREIISQSLLFAAGCRGNRKSSKI